MIKHYIIIISTVITVVDALLTLLLWDGFLLLCTLLHYSISNPTLPTHSSLEWIASINLGSPTWVKV